MKNSVLELVAETHYMIRPSLKNALRSQILLGAGVAMFPNCNNYFDVWQTRFGDKFFDMATLIRIATAIESVLRDYYMMKKGHINQISLRSDPNFRIGIFQKIMPWNDKCQQLFDSLNIDLRIIPDLAAMQEIMLHRHLYAHNAGILDDKYIVDLKRLTAIDLLMNTSIISSYPADDLCRGQNVKNTV